MSLRIWWSAILVGALAGCASAPPQDKSEPIVVPPPTAGSQRGNLISDGIPDAPEELRNSLRRYQNTRPSSFLGWLPDDTGALISVRFGDVPQLAKVTQLEGMRTQLTFFDEPVTTAEVSPNREVNGAIFAKDRGGDEYFQLHFLSFADGSTRLLTDGKSRNEGAVFAHDGRRFAYSSTQRTSRDFDIWIGDLGADAPHRLALQKGGTWYPLDFSADGSRLLVMEWISALDARIHELEIATGALKRISVGRGFSSDRFARYEPDGRHVLVLSDALGEFSGLVRVDLASGVALRQLPKLPWDVEEFDLSADGNYLALLRNVDGSSTITIHDRNKDLAETASIALENGVVGHCEFNHAGTEIGFAVSGPQIPGDVFSRRLASGLLSRWTRGETGGIDPNTFVMPTLFRYGAHDPDAAAMNLPRQIPAHLYQPAGAGPFPVLVMIHGGPEAQARPSFSEFIQFMVRERGVAVIVPNVRGSTGYGKTYLGLDDGERREDSVKDIGSLLGWIGTQSQLDASRVAVYGGSYGGFMVLASLVNYSESLRAGVDIVGISSFVTFLENTNPYRVDQRRPEYGDERDPKMREFLTRISPLTQVDKINRPLLIIQGANDPRVPRSEAEQILSAVRGKGQTAWYLLALDEGHGFRKKGNKDRMGEVVVQFLDQHLLGTQSEKPTAQADSCVAPCSESS